jgi:hypothetical protein
MICPKCKKENDDNWALLIDGKATDGGCQECWESDCDAEWWGMLGKLSESGLLGGSQ